MPDHRPGPGPIDTGRPRPARVYGNTPGGGNDHSAEGEPAERTAAGGKPVGGGAGAAREP